MPPYQNIFEERSFSRWLTCGTYLSQIKPASPELRETVCIEDNLPAPMAARELPLRRLGIYPSYRYTRLGRAHRLHKSSRQQFRLLQPFGLMYIQALL